MVTKFTKALQNGDSDLLRELADAYEFVIKESVRNSMIASCKAAEMFPPLPSPASVGHQDCSWDGAISVSAPVIAQRLYNDEVQRLHDPANRQNILAKTASFVTEFADEMGAELPEMPSKHTDRLQQFQQDLLAWTTEAAQPAPNHFATFLENAGELQCKLLMETDKLIANRNSFSKLSEHRDTLLWGTAGLAVAGALSIAALRIANPALRIEI